MFTTEGGFSMGGQAQAADRDQRITDLYEQQATNVLRLVTSRVRAPRAVVEDACQTAWTRLYEHAEVDVDGPGAVRWLVITAMREAWKLSAQRETPVGSWSAQAVDREFPGGELPEPAGNTPDPLDVAIEREHTRELKARLAKLTDRERQFLTLHAAGLTYHEIAAEVGASLRTVERQILRARRKLREAGRAS
jgi:RNA polymerase sigma factor (sigma-70 family)